MTVADIERINAQRGKGFKRTGVVDGEIQIERIEPAKRSKHGSVKTEVDGIVFDSKTESERYQTLKLLQKAGKITDLQHHRCFALFACPSDGGRFVHVGDYETDLTYFDEHEELVVEDVKSAHTRKLPLYRWKKKHFEAQYGLQIREV